ncbi:siderophore-interacting protein [Krasilnikoviella flava]|uniref:NADPH-dependent ferric siderophore reductase, contains FAD-binding and SIP domains n=1 Tax=Krasilnikoviella flava TaxID=526729 RepID=A0A1T5K272_9MICO|nr:siderophore-interacting protein [Krasilnikoviella flava]SKC57872.1 NADPH-dependent ferric siderophore reductase, contains FAD-binding and SIP domains [Krasilnikoviella flava]
MSALTEPVAVVDPRGPRPEAYFDDFPIRIRELTVLRRTHVTPRMVRVTLGGPDMDGFESHQADEHCKLVFPDADTGRVRVPWQADDGEHLDWPDPFPPTREYTIRRYDPVAREVDLDFVVHPGGLASDWAQTVEPGETLWVAGPRPGLVVPPEFGFLVLLADETALPAVARWLEELPDDARGVAAIEVADAAEEQELRVPAGFTLTWLHRDGAAPGSTRLLGDFAEGIELPTDTWAYVWAFAEAGCVKPVRRWARAQGIGKRQSDIGGYWKAGRTNSFQDVVADPSRHEEMHERQREHDDHDDHDE